MGVCDARPVTETRPRQRTLLREEPLDSPAARVLTAQVQQEYVRRYGGEDTTPMHPVEFAPPAGLFLVAYRDDDPVGCGGWRAYGTAGEAELKRMYVVPAARGLGVARALLARLEETARAAGFARLVLETGLEQPEAITLYTSAGYRPVASFGTYRDEPSALHLGRTLTP